MDIRGPVQSWRPWRDPRWLAAGAIALLLGMALFGLFAPDPPIEISPRTTSITAPLADDGLPDYHTAILTLAGPAPPPEENAAVDLLEVFWLEDVSTPDARAVCAALGIADRPPTPRLAIPKWNGPGMTLEKILTAAEAPWKAIDKPDLAAWITANDIFLERLVTAADKPRFWFAGPDLLRKLPYAVPYSLLPREGLRFLPDLLGCRALLHVGEGRMEAAWRDLRAMRRWGRLLGDPRSGPRIGLDRYSVLELQEQTALATARHVVASPSTPPALLAEIRAEFADVRRIDAEELLRADRLVGLANVLMLAQRNPGGRGSRAILVENFAESHLRAIVGPAASTRLDWNGVLIDFNRVHDELVAALGLPTFAARRAELVRLWADRDRPVAAMNDSRALNHLRYLIDPALQRTVMASWCAREWLGLSPDVNEREEAGVALVQASLALAAWRADRGPADPPFPDRLEDLVPGWMASVPLDPYADAPLAYRRDGEACRIWSVGPNGRDDGGKEPRDMVVRHPARPPRSGPAAVP